MTFLAPFFTWCSGLQVMMKLKSAKNLDARQTMLLEHAYFQVRMHCTSEHTQCGLHTHPILPLLQADRA